MTAFCQDGFAICLALCILGVTVTGAATLGTNNGVPSHSWKISPSYEAGLSAVQSAGTSKERRAVFSIIKPHNAYLSGGGYSVVGLAPSSGGVVDDAAYGTMRRARVKSPRIRLLGPEWNAGFRRFGGEGLNRYETAFDESGHGGNNDIGKEDAAVDYGNRDEVIDDGFLLNHRPAISVPPT